MIVRHHNGTIHFDQIRNAKCAPRKLLSIVALLILWGAVLLRARNCDAAGQQERESIMTLRQAGVFAEFLETRRLLAAPVILKVSDAVEAGNSFTINGGGIAAQQADVAMSREESVAEPVPAGVVFQADFNGPNGGTGGSGDMVSIGGTGMLSATTGVSNSVISTKPFTAGSGSYLHSEISVGAPLFLPLSSFGFASASNSFAAMQGADINGNTTLNGGFDVFYRPNAIKAGEGGYFRPIDTVSGAGGDHLRLIFNGTGSGNLVLQLASMNGAAVSDFTSLSGGAAFSTNESVWLTGGNIATVGQIYHMGFTLSTDGTGLITARMFLVNGTGAINTALSPLAAATFRLNAAVIGSAFNDADRWTLREFSEYNSPNGHTIAANFDMDRPRIYDSAPATFASLPTTGIEPPTGAVHPQIVQTDKDGHYVVAKAPGDLQPGIYNIWVKNADGWSKPYKLNAARALYQSEYQAYYSATKPITIEVVGRNFDQREFGGILATQVRLSNGVGGVFDQSVSGVNPYHVAFTVGNVPQGTYYVEVSNDNGANWSRPESGQTLTIVPPPAAGDADPLNLRVPWAKDFNWANKVDVTQDLVRLGIAGANINPSDSSGDDRSALQAAMDYVQTHGGGVVYLPNGNYYAGYLSIGDGVVVQGQDKQLTKLYYTGGGGSTFIQTKRTGLDTSKGELQGLARLSVLLSNNADLNLRPDVIIFLGELGRNGSVADQSLRTANRVFMTDVNVSYPYTVGNSDATAARRAIGLLITARERVLLQNNTFVGWYSTIPLGYVSRYMLVRDNSFEYSTGYVHSTANYLFYENNWVRVHGEYIQDSHGLFGRADAYMADNDVEGTGSDNPDPNGDGVMELNDGEGLCVEMPGGLYNRGTVSSATATTLTVATTSALVYPATQYGQVSVVITYGAGLGQLRRVIAVDAASSTITVDRAFDILPDSTSTFTMYSPLENFTAYHNTLNNTVAGILPYGAQHDAVIADNLLTNTVGIFTFAARSDAGDSAGQYIRIARNLLSGVSRRSNTSAIGIYTGRFDVPTFVDTMIYSVEILENTITGDLSKTMDGRWYFPAYNGIYLSSYEYSNRSDGTGTGDITNSLIERNTLNDLQSGIMLTKGDYGHVISNNKSNVNVIQFLRDGGSQNTLISSDNFYAKGLNISSEGTLSVWPQSPIAGGASDINVIRDGYTPQLSPRDDRSFDDLQTNMQYENQSALTPYTQYYGYTFSGDRTFSRLVFVEGRHFSNGGWFANGSAHVQVRQGGNWVDVATNSVRPYPVGNTLATFGTGYEAYDFGLNNVVGDGIRIIGTAGGSGHFVSVSEVQVYALPPAPTTVNFMVNDGSAQRSMIGSLTLSFDQAVVLASDAIALTARGRSGTVPLVISTSADARTFLITFTSPLSDGAYTLMVKGSSVADPYGQLLIGGDRIFKFHRLFGDINGDRVVNSTDAAVFKLALNNPINYVWYLDYDGSGSPIDSIDYQQMRLRMIKPLI